MPKIPPSTNDLLTSLDAKLGAMLTHAVDAYIRETGIAKPKERSIDRMLSDVGVSTGDIAKLLGKTERAVQLVLKDERERADKARAQRRPKATGKAKPPADAGK